jgi:hypothetical protein
MMRKTRRGKPDVLIAIGNDHRISSSDNMPFMIGKMDQYDGTFRRNPRVRPAVFKLPAIRSCPMRSWRSL